MKTRILSTLVILALLLVPTLPAQTGPFTESVGFATKTGFRLVFSWKASQPVRGIVRYGLDPANLNRTAQPLPGIEDTAQIAVVDIPRTEIGRTIYWRVEDSLTGARTAIDSFVAANAYNAWNGHTYTINLLVQLDAQDLPSDIPSDQALSDIGAGVNIFAERLFDAMDGYARLGKVIITDTNLDYAANVPFQQSPVCSSQANLADVLVQTTVPLDSHTYGGWAIDRPCTSFYVGRYGQLIIPWQDDLHFGYVSTHELMHYAFNAPDLYLEATAEEAVPAACRNLSWDGSLMHNSGGWRGQWELTELDRNPQLTPCEHGSLPWTWDNLRVRYTEVPLNPEGPIDHIIDTKARGNADGGALEMWILNREPMASSLTSFTPDDSVPACSNALPQIVDPADDSTGFERFVGTPAPNEDSLDVLRAYLRWNPSTETVSFNIDVKDLGITPPYGALGQLFRFSFNYDDRRYQIRAIRTVAGAEFTLNRLDLTAVPLLGDKLADLQGTFDPDLDRITIHLPADTMAAVSPSSPRFRTGEEINKFELIAQRYNGAVAFTSDTARGSCNYYIGQEQFAGNSAPIANPDSATTAEDIPVRVDVLANDVDPDGDPLSVRSASAPFGSVVVNADNSVTFTPKKDFSGTARFEYVVTDGRTARTTGNVEVTVTPAQDPPVAVDDSALASADGPTAINVLENDYDIDGDPLTIVAVTNGAKGTVTTNGATATYNPGPGFTSSDQFTYTISDGNGNSASATVTVTRTCIGSFSDDLEPAPEPGWTFSNNNRHPTTQTWRHVVDASASSPTHVFFSDALEGASSDKDDRLIAPPQYGSALTKLSFWHRYSIELDFDGAVLEISTNGGSTWSDIVTAGGVFLKGGYTGSSAALGGRPAWNGISPSFPAMNEVVVDLSAFAGKQFLVRWRLGTDILVGDLGWWIDDIRFIDTAVVNCSTPENRAPIAVDDTAATQRGSSVTVDVLANDSDPDGDSISVSSLGAPQNGSASHDGSRVTYTPNAGYNGTDTFQYTIGDGRGGSATASVTIRVNAPPTAANDSASTPEDTAVTIDVVANDGDADGDTLTVSSASNGSIGTTSVNGDGTVTYTPAPNAHGSDSFTYTVSDGHGGSASAVVSVTVTPVNDAPNAVDDAVSVSGNGMVFIAVLANDSDVDGDTLTVVSVTKPTHGTAVVHPSGTVRYRPRPNYSGADSFTYTVSDGNGGVSTATVRVTVSN